MPIQDLLLKALSETYSSTGCSHGLMVNYQSNDVCTAQIMYGGNCIMSQTEHCLDKALTILARRFLESRARPITAVGNLQAYLEQLK